MNLLDPAGCVHLKEEKPTKALQHQQFSLIYLIGNENFDKIGTGIIFLKRCIKSTFPHSF